VVHESTTRIEEDLERGDLSFVVIPAPRSWADEGGCDRFRREDGAPS
jgi:hypothetical protein